MTSFKASPFFVRGVALSTRHITAIPDLAWFLLPSSGCGGHRNIDDVGATARKKKKKVCRVAPVSGARTVARSGRDPPPGRVRKQSREARRAVGRFTNTER